MYLHCRHSTSAVKFRCLPWLKGTVKRGRNPFSLVRQIRLSFPVSLVVLLNLRVVLPYAIRYYSAMNTLTIKIPPVLEQELLQLSEQAHLSKSELVRRALTAFIAQRKTMTPSVSALDQAGDLVGCFGGGPTDLSSNPAYLKGFGSV